MALLDLVTIDFTSRRDTTVQTVGRGVVALLLQDVASTVGTYLFQSRRDILEEMPSELSEKNKNYIRLAFKDRPTAVFVFVKELVEAVTWDPKTDDAFAEIDTGTFDYITIPEISPADAQKVAEWVETVNEDKDHIVKAVLPKTAGDDRHIINFATEWVVDEDGKRYETSEYTPRIAGYFGAMFPDRSSMYQILPGVGDVPKKSRKELDALAEKGELHLFKDNNVVRFASGVNSLVTLADDMSEIHKQIKDTEIMDMLHNSIKRSLLDKFIGKYSNSYANKLLIVSEINDFLREFERMELLEMDQNECFLDLEAQADYLLSINYRTPDGRKVREMTEEEIKRANTRRKVFLRMRIQVLGAIESIEIKVEV